MKPVLKPSLTPSLKPSLKPLLKPSVKSISKPSWKPSLSTATAIIQTDKTQYILGETIAIKLLLKPSLKKAILRLATFTFLVNIYMSKIYEDAITVRQVPKILYNF